MKVLVPTATLVLLSVVTGLQPGSAQTSSPPVIFFSDLDGGPKAGGQNNAGAFVTIYGTHFGASQATSTVTIGGGQAAAYPVWTDRKITVQLGAAAATGSIVVTTANGTSNGIPFTVRAGNIYFVATNGNDANNGSFGSPWATLLKARDTIQPGDIAYGMNGVSQTADDGQGWSTSMLLRTGGSLAAPKAIVAYPGATVTIGSITGPAYGIRAIDNGTFTGYWTFAGLVLRGGSSTMVLSGPSNNTRIIGNDMSCPNGDGEVGCFATQKSSYVYFYGNNVHDAGVATASAHYHGVYFSTDSNHLDMGWNTVSNVHGCRGIQTHSSPLGGGGSTDPTGYNMYDISIHDNVIHDTQCDGIILATVDPSLGKIEVYNNIIYNAGKGPNNPEQTGGWTCVNVPGTTANGNAGGGTVEVYGNTMYNCGSFATPPYANANAAVENGGNNTNLKIRIRNNILYQVSPEPYLVIYGPADGIQGSNNLFFGNGAPPSSAYLSASVANDPLFVNLAGYDFHLTSSSPAATAGTPTSQARDFDGVPLPQGSGFPIGALAYPGGTWTSPVTVSVTPSTVTLQGAQTQQFAATVSAAVNTSVTWAMNPAAGTLSFGGLYTAPSSITSVQTIQVTATSVADPTRSSGATITLMPTVSVSVSPATATLTASQTQQFTAAVTGATNTGVTWTVSPAVGSVSSSGLYTAPSSISATQTVQIRATSSVDPTKSATATITLNPPVTVVTVAVSLTPGAATLTASQTQQFTPTVTGSSNTGVTWTLNPAVGSISAAGLYTAPSTISATLSVQVTTTSVADPTKSASAAVTLNPPPVATVGVAVSPSTVSLTGGQQQQFAASVTGTTTTGVTWTINPAVGSLSTSGLYTAPATITSVQPVQITATSLADPTKSASATVTLDPPTSGSTGFTLSWTAISSTQVRVDFTAPAGQSSSDWIALSGVGAPAWWYTAYRYTRGGTSGSFTFTLPATPGYYEFRYNLRGSYTTKATSAPLPVGLAPFSLTAGQTTAPVGGKLTVTWNVPSGRPSTDSVGLYPVGAQNDQDLWHQYPNGVTAGTSAVTAPTTPGIYEFRWRIGYLAAARSAPITVQ